MTAYCKAGTDDIKDRRERGNTIVETALIILPLFTIVLAIVDFSMVAFVRTTLQHAVREGTRYAITSQTVSGSGSEVWAGARSAISAMRPTGCRAPDG